MRKEMGRGKENRKMSGRERGETGNAGKGKVLEVKEGKDGRGETWRKEKGKTNT